MITFTLFVCATLVKISGADWCYESQYTCNSTCTEPDRWPVVSKQCDGMFQSPINIVTRKMRTDELLSPFQFTGYQDMFRGVIKNTGHNVEVDLPVAATIKGGNLTATYKAMQLHLHWGSEHTIDGERFPMEIHIVHVKEEYNSIPEALRDRTGVAVLGFFYQESESSNKKYDPIIDALEDIKHPTGNTTISGVSLDMLLPPLNDSSRYFRYQGSLTTPNCDEALIWTVFENPIRLSREQLAAFSELQFANGMQMAEIYRPVQPLNGRHVYYYSEGHVASVSSTLFSASVLATIGYFVHIKS